MSNVHINTINTNQSILDTAILNYDNSISIRPNLEQQEKFQYLRTVGMGSATTIYVTLKGGKLVVLSNKEEVNIRLTSPYTRGLCFPQLTYEDFSNITKEEYHTIDFTTEKCNVVTIEAWGSGSIGWREQYSGSAGGYTKSTIHLKESDGKKTFKIKIGKGGGTNQQSGEDTEIYLCRDDKSDCTLLLTAKGGVHNMGTADLGGDKKWQQVI